MANTTDEAMKMIGQRFKKFRKDNNILQDDLAEVATQITVSRIENGHRLPSVEVLIFIVNKYGADVNWILTGETTKKSTNSNTELHSRMTLLETRVRLLEKESGKVLFK